MASVVLAVAGVALVIRLAPAPRADVAGAIDVVRPVEKTDAARDVAREPPLPEPPIAPVTPLVAIDTAWPSTPPPASVLHRFHVADADLPPGLRRSTKGFTRDDGTTSGELYVGVAFPGEEFVSMFFLFCDVDEELPELPEVLELSMSIFRDVEDVELGHAVLRCRGAEEARRLGAAFLAERRTYLGAPCSPPEDVTVRDDIVLVSWSDGPGARGYPQLAALLKARLEGKDV